MNQVPLRGDADQIESIVEEELPRLAAFTSSAGQLDVRPVVGLLIGTAVVLENEYHCYMAELQLI